MNVEFLQAAAALIKAVVVVVGMFEDGELVGRSSALDSQTNQAISKAVLTTKFEAKVGNNLLVSLADGNSALDKMSFMIVIGLGKEEDFNSKIAQNIGGIIIEALKKYKSKTATILFDLKNESIISHVAYGAMLKSYTFDKYKTKTPEDNFKLDNIVFAVENEVFAGEEYNKELQHIAYSVYLTRDLINEPPNVLYPESYVDFIKSHAGKVPGLEIKVLDVKDMTKLGMGALLGVAQGSRKDGRVVALKWSGDEDKSVPPIAILGKGVTFDTGGVSLKPPNGMWDMKYDMAGSATAFGTIYSLALRKAKVNVVAILGVVENAIGGNAQRPSDVVYSMSGKTIEVLNTDAEGRLVLADLITYAQTTYKPKVIIDLATLTGAVVVALGEKHGGLFSNNDDLAEELLKAGKESGETLWNLPMDDSYDKYIDSDIADMKNISTSKAGADSITAAKFLQRFVNKDVPWAHLDIAGVAWSDKDSSIYPKGPTAFGVYLLHNFIKKYEKSTM